MEIVHGLEGLRRLPPGAALTIGNFDGVHLGHARILARCREAAGGAGAGAGGAIVAVTFEPHPLTVLRPDLAPPRLTSPQRKAELLGAEGVTHLVVLPPEPGVLNLEAEAFFALLRDEVRPARLVEGDAFNFGRGRGGTIDRLRQWCAEAGIGLEVVAPVEVALLDLTLVRVSSSLIRFLVQHGRVRDAAVALGRPYELEGPVVRGHQRGRTIGVPTANLKVEQQLVPADGVYAGRCAVDGVTYPAAISIGTMPTFGPNARQVEVHLVGFAGDLYGRTLRVDLLDWLRDQRKFHGVEALKAQMARDIAAAVAAANAASAAAAAVHAGRERVHSPAS